MLGLGRSRGRQRGFVPLQLSAQAIHIHGFSSRNAADPFSLRRIDRAVECDVRCHLPHGSRILSGKGVGRFQRCEAVGNPRLPGQVRDAQRFDFSEFSIDQLVGRDHALKVGHVLPTLVALVMVDAAGLGLDFAHVQRLDRALDLGQFVARRRERGLELVGTTAEARAGRKILVKPEGDCAIRMVLGFGDCGTQAVAPVCDDYLRVGTQRFLLHRRVVQAPDGVVVRALQLHPLAALLDGGVVGHSRDRDLGLGGRQCVEVGLHFGVDCVDCLGMGLGVRLGREVFRGRGQRRFRALEPFFEQGRVAERELFLRRVEDAVKDGEVGQVLDQDR